MSCPGSGCAASIRNALLSESSFQTLSKTGGDRMNRYFQNIREKTGGMNTGQKLSLIHI